MRINIKWLQTGGVPLTNDVMAVVMEAIETFNVLGELAGNLTILSGCDIIGQTVSSGIVCINGDVLFFEGGTEYDNVYIHTEEITKTFQDTTDKVLIEKKLVKFGDASVQYLWDDFVRLETLKEIQIKVNEAVTQTQFNLLKNEVEVLKLKTAPIINGGIVMIWRKPQSEIPIGWKPCEDFRGKTIFGYDPNDFTNTFNILNTPIGSRSKFITKQNIPDYGINFFGATNSGQTAVGNDLSVIKPNGKNADGYYDHTYTINSGGGGQALDVLNPGRIVDFIEPNFQ